MDNEKQEIAEEVNRILWELLTAHTDMIIEPEFNDAMESILDIIKKEDRKLKR